MRSFGFDDSWDDGADGGGTIEALGLDDGGDDGGSREALGWNDGGDGSSS